MLKQSGLSLVELMIAMVIGLVLMLGVSQVFLSSRNVYSNQDAISRMQETERLAVEFIAHDARMAGYIGCASGVVGMTNNAIGAPTVFTAIQNGVEGVEDGFATPPAYGINNRVVSTDMVVLRGVVGTGMTVIAPNASNSVSVDPANSAPEPAACADGTDRLGGVCAGDVAVISDCTKATIFQVDSVNVGGTITPQQTLTANAFNTGAEVALAETIVYYIGTSAATNRTGLWQKIGTNPPAELLEGVENMQILYGRDTNADGIPDAYQKVAQVGSAWSSVLSVRLQLLIGSLEDNVSSESQSYTFNGVGVVPTDRRLHQVVVSTVGIRSRVK